MATTIEEGNLIAASLRVATSGALVRVSDQVLGGLFVLTGAFLVYLVLFDQGADLQIERDNQPFVHLLCVAGLYQPERACVTAAADPANE
jgi:hypothetical protein